jgi:hypothetical protein
MEMGQILAGEAGVSKPMRPFGYILRVNLEGNKMLSHITLCATCQMWQVWWVFCMQKRLMDKK